MMLAGSDRFVCIGDGGFPLPRPQQASKSRKNAGAIWRKTVGGGRVLSPFFFSNLHFAHLCSIFAMAKGAPACSFFYALKVPTPLKEAFHPTLRGVIRPEWPCIRGPFDLSFGPNELPSVAVRQNRLDLAGNLMGLTGRTRRMGKHGKASMGKLRVRLFRKI